MGFPTHLVGVCKEAESPMRKNDKSKKQEFVVVVGSCMFL